MAWNPFQLLIPKQYLGIDVGTSFVKIVEISKFGNRRKLENYGSLNASALYEKPFRTFEKSTLLLSSKDVARAITAIMEEAQIKTKQAVFSIPDFSTFFTNFELPLMSNEELAQAVKYEARQLVPIPPAEVTLDWQVIDQKITEEKKTTTKILLLAVPNEVINQYKEIAVLANLELVALEAEAFGLKRALVKEDEKEAVALIDIGAQSTTCNVVDKKTLKTSYSFDVSGNELTEVVSKSLNIDFKKAEELKSRYGLKTLSPEEKAKAGDIRQILLPLTDIIWGEAEKVFNNFFRAEGREVKKVIIAGGSALTPGLKEYFSIRLRREVEIADPFSNIFYTPILEKTLKEMGPSFAIAVGMALRELDY
jgi:type IV pilus assembly protein PilM